MPRRHPVRPEDAARPDPESPEGLASLHFKGQAFLDAVSALKTVRSSSGGPPVRLWKACLKLSKGRLKDLYHYVQAANADFRDVLYWAESYDS